jgi:hypothetical protein
MDEEQGAPQTDIVERSASGDGALSARDAALSLVDTRRKETAQEQPGESRDATADESGSQEPGTAQETGPGETQADDQQQETAAPIDPPRSWTKEDKELFKGLPRETQERLVERERSRETDFLRRQNEAAEKLKGLTAKEQAVDEVRGKYEGALPMLLQTLQQQQAGEFADIKSIADVERMAREDWPRFNIWQAAQMKIAAVHQEVEAANQRAAQERTAKFQTFASEQDALLAEKAPELADKDAKMKAASGAVEMLKELGFSDADLGRMWNGQAEVSLRDHRIQLLIRDGVRYRAAQKAAAKPAPKPVPQVLRPGPAPARNGDADGRVKDLNERLNASGNLRDAAALLAAQRAARR